MLTNPKRAAQNGFTVTEILVTVVIVLALALAVAPLLRNHDSKAKSPGTQQAALETVLAIKAFQQQNAGNIPTTSAQVVDAGFVAPTYAKVWVCPNWSNGTTSTGKFMVRVIAVNADGIKDSNAEQYLYDSAKDSAPRSVSQTEAATKFCGGETGVTWPAGGTAYQIT